MEDLTVDGMALSAGVVETIIGIAVREVEGVANVGALTSVRPGLLSSFGRKPSSAGIEVLPLEDGSFAVEVHIEVTFGSVFPEVAAAVRSAVADAFSTQLGARVASVDVFIDGVQF